MFLALQLNDVDLESILEIARKKTLAGVPIALVDRTLMST